MMEINSKKIFSEKGGFTIVELIVSISIFLVVISVVTGIFIQSFKTQRFLSSLMAINSNTGLMLEQIMRETRSGFDFSVCEAGVCAPDDYGDTLKFTRVRDGAPVQISFSWNEDEGRVERTEGSSPATLLSMDEAKVNNLRFRLSQADALAPWRVNIFMSVNSRYNPIPENEIFVETTVSARLLPNEVI